MGTAYSYSFLTSSEVELIFLHVVGKKKKELKERDVVALTMTAKLAKSFFQLLLHNFFFINLFIYFWLCWVFVSVQGLSPVAVSGGHSSSRCVGLSLSRPLPLRSTGSRRAGSVVVAHGPSHSTACGIFLDRGTNPCPLHWQTDS